MIDIRIEVIFHFLLSETCKFSWEASWAISFGVRKGLTSLWNTFPVFVALWSNVTSWVCHRWKTLIRFFPYPVVDIFVRYILFVIWSNLLVKCSFPSKFFWESLVILWSIQPILINFRSNGGSSERYSIDAWLSIVIDPLVYIIFCDIFHLNLSTSVLLEESLELLWEDSVQLKKRQLS